MNRMWELVLKAKKHYQEGGCKDLIKTTTMFLRRRWERLTQRSEYLDQKLPYDQSSFLTEKKGPTIYLMAGIPYYDIGGGQRCAQLAKTFNKMGYPVRYFYAYPSADKRDKQIVIPTVTHAHIDGKAIRYVKNCAKQEDIFIFEAPFRQFEPLLEIAVQRGCRIIYESIDNWETSLGSDFFEEAILKKMLTRADVLVGTARPLVKQLEQYLERFAISKTDKSILYLANAVDEELFCGAKTCDMPEDLVKGTRTLVYYGSLWGEWFRWDMLMELATAHPEYSINLIGNADGIPHRVSQCPENIHFLGLKPQIQLPAYLRYADYALLPFERGAIGDYVSPLKIFEYISMYTKVLSTSLPDIEGYPNVYFGDTAADWEAVIKRDPAVDVISADQFTEKNTWFHRASAMLQALSFAGPLSDAGAGDGDGGSKKAASPLRDKLAIVILNYNNKNIIFKCLNSLLRYRSWYGYEIIVVDNGSKDGSYEMLQQRYTAEEISLYRNHQNGCASGRNLGVSKTSKEYVLFLDSDQWVTSGFWLKPFERIMEVHGDFGSIGWAAGFFDRAGASCRTVDDFSGRYMPALALCRSDIGYLGSGGMLMRTADFWAIGGFDTYYDPTCYEDTDISLKIRDHGKELYYCPYLGVIHLPHQTTNAGTQAHQELTRQKQEYFIGKWKKKNPKLLDHVK